jgi:hypothetical protein
MDDRERLRQAQGSTDSPTYRVLKGYISEREYRDLVNQERRRHGLPAIKQANRDRQP